MKKYYLLIVALLTFYTGYSQMKGANTIKVSGVTFKEVAYGLLDHGYSFEKIDSNFQTIRTELKSMTDYVMKIRLEVRVKDSTAIIKGSWVSSSYVFDIENQKWAAYKATFASMNKFALSFKKPVEYSIVK